MKEYHIEKKITKECSTALMSEIGKKLTEEYSKQPKIAEDEKSLSGLDFISFSFTTESHKLSESTIEKFIEQFELQEGHGSYMLKLRKKELNIFFSGNNKMNFTISSVSEDQVWAEGITAVFYKLINEFKPLMIKSEETETPKIIEKTIIKEPPSEESSNKYTRFFKKYLYPLIIGIIATAVGGLILALII